VKHAPIPALLRSVDEDLHDLAAPLVGLFTVSVEAGQWLEAGARLGHLEVVDQRYTLLVPQGIAGRVVRLNSKRRHASVEYGEALLQLRAGEALVNDGVVAIDTDGLPPDLPAGARVFRSSMDGQFYGRPSPADPAFVNVGAMLQPGATLGLIEVMKFFYPVTFDGAQPLRVERILVADATPVESGQPLLVLVPAED
jgi:acetyl-CoA carboxylase biotin carboxyl carrier protein